MTPRREVASSNLPILVRLTTILIIVRPLMDPLRDTQIGALAVTDFIGGLVVLGVFWNLSVGQLPAPTSVLSFRLLCLFTIVLTITSLLAALIRGSELPVSSIIRVMFILSAAILFFGLSRLNCSYAWRAWLWMTVPSCIWGAGHVLTGGGQEPNVYSPLEEQLTRATGPFIHPSVLAGVAMVVLVVATARARSEGSPQNRKYWLLSLLALVALYGTFSRIYLIAVVAATVLVLVGGLARVAFIYLGAISTATFLAVAGDQLLLRLSGSSSLDYRFQLWKSLIDHADPWIFLVGHGSGGFSQFVLEATSRAGIFRVPEAHNDYLRVLLESGILGLCLYTSAYLVMWREAGRDAFMDRASRGLIIATGIVAVTDNLFNVLVVQGAFWGFMGLAMAERAQQAWPRPERNAGNARTAAS